MTLIRKDRIWPTIVVTVLLGNLALGVVLYRVANADSHFAVEADYYRKALDWDSTQAQDARNASLGWRVTPAMGPLAAPSPTRLTLDLAAADGTPLTGATATLEARQVAHAAEVITATLGNDVTPGQLVGELALDREGLWELRILIDHAGQRFTDQLRLDVSRDAPARVVRARPGDPIPARLAAGLDAAR